MKYIFFILLIISCNQKKTEKTSSHSLQENVSDSSNISDEQTTVRILYKESLQKLEEIVEKKMPYDHSDGFKAVNFLGEISGYSGNGNHNYFGTFGFKKEDLNYWKKWYEKNKDSLNYIYIPKDTLNQ